MACKTKACGCIDTGLTTPGPCPCDAYSCPSPDPCAETISDECVIHTGDSLPEIGIFQGDSLATVLQTLAVWLLNPTCADPTSTCRSVLNVHSIAISPYTVKVGWINVGSDSVQVEYREANAVSWTLNPSLVPPVDVDTIGGLLPDTFYQIRVNGICEFSNCYSAVILVKTKPI